MSEDTHTRPPAEKSKLEELLDSATESLNKAREKRRQAKANAGKALDNPAPAPTVEQQPEVKPTEALTPPPAPTTPKPVSDFEIENTREDRKLKHWLIKRIVNVVSLVVLIVINAMIYAYIVRGDKMDTELIKDIFGSLKDILGMFK